VKAHHFVVRGFVLGALVSSTASMPVCAQTSEQWAAHYQRVARVRAELQNLEATGKIMNFTLAEWLRLPWMRDPSEDIGDGDIRRLNIEIDKEKRRRASLDEWRRSRDSADDPPSHTILPQLPELPPPPRWQ
jgi:hypothetical protein